MGVIQALSQETINQIAAGEVIERPASIVKELVENAIDAKATSVTVEIKEGGMSLIRITDNGCGIDKEDVRIAFQPHTTSKIRSALDLLTVSSLGFRGEALSSIAAVCQVELVTKTADAISGTMYNIEGGQEKSMRDVGAPVGTTFFVRNIFFNTPARRKFLKSAQTEAGYITSIMESIALSHPDISFQLTVNGQNKLYTNGSGKMADACYSVFGRNEVADFLELPETTADDRLKLNGFIAKPHRSRGNRDMEYYFINGRYVKSKIIAAAIEEGYRGFLMQHRYPIVALNLTVSPELIDVNVHPAKMELRFRNEDEVFRLVRDAIIARLKQQNLILDSDEDEEEKQDTKPSAPAPEPFMKARETMNRTHSQNTRPEYVTADLKPSVADVKKTIAAYEGAAPEHEKHAPAKKVTPSLKGDSFLIDDADDELPDFTKNNPVKETKVSEPEVRKPEEQKPEVKSPEAQNVFTETQTAYTAKPVETKDEEQVTLFNDELFRKELKSKYKLIGQIFDTYWLIQFEDKLLIMDQHAAHEKVLYEKNVKFFKEKKAESQYISPPIVLHITHREQQCLEQYQSYFEEFGYEIESFGPDAYAIRAVPSNLYKLDQQELFVSLLDELLDYAPLRTEESAKEMALSLFIDKLATMACKAAIKGNMAISFAEADKLVDDLLKLDNPYMCPHGRPTLISMSKYELERKFSRKI
ncbi:MAG: DNA mismatch repair endonuclease MutL [Lachnospiraceae bacterium]|nr:DNA mismatch repair endonuclease MutL [Lachnospiraceae bacterium]